MEEYKQKLKELGMIDFGGAKQSDGDNFVESWAKALPPEGWGTFTIIESKQHNGNLIYTAANMRGEEAGIFLGFGQPENWQRESAKASLGKMMQVCNVQGSGAGGAFLEADIIKFHGRSFDGKVKYRPSKKNGQVVINEATGEPYLNADIKNFAPAGSQAGAGVSGQAQSRQSAKQNMGMSAFVGSESGNASGDVSF